MCLEANAPPRRTYREPIIPSFPRKRESRAFPGILDSRVRGNDASKVPLFSRELKASFVVRLGADLVVAYRYHSRTLAVITKISALLVPPTAAFPTTTF